MNEPQWYGIAADALLIIHTLFACFLIFGLLFIFVGKLLSWKWVTNPWFRSLHLLGIAVVVVQSWLGVICPLTSWEMALRSKAQQSTYEGSFIAHWLNDILYIQAPWWVFVLVYTLFGFLVLLSWVLVPSRKFGASR